MEVLRRNEHFFLCKTEKQKQFQIEIQRENAIKKRRLVRYLTRVLLGLFEVLMSVSPVHDFFLSPPLLVFSERPT